jgi:hypothetical protein
MMTQSTAPTVGAATHSRMQAREEAAWAMHLAARSLAIEPAALSTAAYRTFRATQEEPGLPSPLAISLLFVGWQRACEHVAALTCDETEVEADVVRALYGDPAGRQRARATCGQRSRAQLGEIARQTGRRVRRGDIVSETARIGCAPSDCPESESDARDRT